MQTLFIAGNVGRDAQLRTAGSDPVLNFSIAVNNGKDKSGQERPATWYDCAVWGKRGEALERHITKGCKLAVTGRPTVRVHEGKAYLGVSVDQLTFLGGGGGRDDQSARGQHDGQAPSRDLDGEIPF